MKPDDKVIIAGGTGKGKTVLECYIADRFLDVQPLGWQQIIIDVQNDEKVNFKSKAQGWETTDPTEFIRWVHSKDKPRIVFRAEGENDDEDVYDEIFQHAYERRYCTVILDELSAMFKNPSHPKAGAKNMIQRGRAHHVGLIGLVQDPVFIPRTIKSQAGYMILYPNGLEYKDTFVKKWIPPEYASIYTDFPTEHGFWIWRPSDAETIPHYVESIPVNPLNPYNHPRSCDCFYCEKLKQA